MLSSPLSLLLLSSSALLAAALNVSIGYTSQTTALGFFSVSLALMLLTIYKIFRHVATRELRLLALERRAAKINRSAGAFMLDRLTELRRPLQGLAGVYDLYSGESSPVETKDYFEITNFCSRFLIRQLERTHFFLELEGETLRLDAVHFSLKDCVASAIAQANESLPMASAPIVVDFPADIPDAVFGNKFAIHSLLSELLINSLKFSSNGLIALKISADLNSNNRFCITLSDTGPGLPSTYITRINSNTSSRARPRAWPLAKGGIGLLIVKKVIGLLNGSIQVKAQTGGGTSYSIELPEQALRAANIEKIATKSHHVSKLRVLVVDDEPLALQVICFLLKKLGVSAETAIHGQEALHKCRENTYDVIFMDLAMPVMDGFEAGRIIKSTIHNSGNIDIVALSALCKQSDIDRCNQLGFSDFLAKPAGLEKIRDCLMRLNRIENSAPPSNLICLDDARKRNLSKKSATVGYYINFNALYNSLEEDMSLCHDVLKQVGINLNTELDRLARALNNFNQKELEAILHKITGELTLVHCQPGIEAVNKMSAALPLGDVKIQSAFENMSTVFDGIGNEIEHLCLKKSDAA